MMGLNTAILQSSGAPPTRAALFARSFRVLPMESSSRPSLAAEAAARFRRIVDTEFGLVWRFLRGLGVPVAGVDDAAQQVFLVAAQRLDDIAVGSERAFLLATARGVAANARRAQSRNREVLDERVLADHTDDRANPEQAAAATEARELLATFLDGLPEDVRTVFVLFELEGMTMAAIAQTLELAPGTVASRLRRARDEFHAAAKRFQAQHGARGRS
jgi:RNA polymerase sigma-70 factor (ECF subfamily)